MNPNLRTGSRNLLLMFSSLTKSFPGSLFTLMWKTSLSVALPLLPLIIGLPVEENPYLISLLNSPYVEEETDESIFWLEYTNGIDKKWEPLTKPLIQEGNELTAIIVASIKTSKKRNIKLKSRY